MIPNRAHPVIFFDGVCNLCNRAVTYILHHDPHGIFKFAPLQSPYAKAQIGERRIGNLSSIVLLHDGRIYERSDAVLRIARRLTGPSKLLYAFIVVPRFMRDAVYRFIARHRYTWFGTTTTCRVPTENEKTRFVNALNDAGLTQGTHEEG